MFEFSKNLSFRFLRTQWHSTLATGGLRDSWSTCLAEHLLRDALHIEITADVQGLDVWIAREGQIHLDDHQVVGGRHKSSVQLEYARSVLVPRIAAPFASAIRPRNNATLLGLGAAVARRRKLWAHATTGQRLRSDHRIEIATLFDIEELVVHELRVRLVGRVRLSARPWRPNGQQQLLRHRRALLEQHERAIGSGGHRCQSVARVQASGGASRIATGMYLWRRCRTRMREHGIFTMFISCRSWSKVWFRCARGNTSAFSTQFACPAWKRIASFTTRTPTTLLWCTRDATSKWSSTTREEFSDHARFKCKCADPIRRWRREI